MDYSSYCHDDLLQIWTGVRVNEKKEKEVAHPGLLERKTSMYLICPDSDS